MWHIILIASKSGISRRIYEVDYSSNTAYKGQGQGKRDGGVWGERMRQQEPWRRGQSRQADRERA